MPVSLGKPLITLIYFFLALGAQRMRMTEETEKTQVAGKSGSRKMNGPRSKLKGLEVIDNLRGV